MWARASSVTSPLTALCSSTRTTITAASPVPARPASIADRATRRSPGDPWSRRIVEKPGVLEAPGIAAARPVATQLLGGVDVEALGGEAPDHLHDAEHAAARQLLRPCAAELVMQEGEQARFKI